MGKKKVGKKLALPEGGPSAAYSSPSPSKEDEPVTYPEEEQESPYQGEDEEEQHDEELEVEEEEEENQSDSETSSASPTASDFKVQAVTPSPKKPNSTKRPIQESEKNAAEPSRKRKKAKRVAVEEEAEKSKTSSVRPSNRLWSEEDEVVILEGLTGFPSSDMAVFYKSVKKSLSVDVPMNKFADKISKLRRKYKKNVARGEKADLSSPHERRCFELSRKIWGGNKNGGGGNGNGNGNGNGSNDAGEQTGKVEVSLGEGSEGRERKDLKVDKVGDFWAMHPFLKRSFSGSSMEEPLKGFVMENMTRIGSRKAKALERKWKDLVVDEYALYLKRVQLMGEQTKLVLDSTKASKD